MRFILLILSMPILILIALAINKIQDKKNKINNGFIRYNADNHYHNEKDYTDSQCNDESDVWGLDDYEKEEVRKGNYEPCDFDEDDMDEDSYYDESDE